MFNWFKKKEVEIIPAETKIHSLVGTHWGIRGVNNDEPIIEITKVEDGFVSGNFYSQGNEGRTHYQNLSDFYNCFFQC